MTERWKCELLKPNDVARWLAVSRAWVYDAAKTGRIPSIRIGGEDGPLRFVREGIERWLDEARAAWKPGRGVRPLTNGRDGAKRRARRPSDLPVVIRGQQSLL
jgi:predicted DNA-binding transcriptional regulator AlpA